MNGWRPAGANRLEQHPMPLADPGEATGSRGYSFAWLAV